VGRATLTILGLAIVAVAATFIAKNALRPNQEEVQRKQDVLTHAYLPSLIECTIVEDSDLPPTLPRPEVDEDLLYIAVVVFYPGVDRVPEPREHRLERVNGVAGVVLEPVHTSYEQDEDGTYITLLYRTDNSFRYGRMVRGDRPLFERVVLE